MNSDWSLELRESVELLIFSKVEDYFLLAHLLVQLGNSINLVLQLDLVGLVQSDFMDSTTILLDSDFLSQNDWRLH